MHQQQQHALSVAWMLPSARPTSRFPYANAQLGSAQQAPLPGGGLGQLQGEGGWVAWIMDPPAPTRACRHARLPATAAWLPCAMQCTSSSMASGSCICASAHGQRPASSTCSSTRSPAPRHSATSRSYLHTPPHPLRRGRARPAPVAQMACSLPARSAPLQRRQQQQMAGHSPPQARTAARTSCTTRP